MKKVSGTLTLAFLFLAPFQVFAGAGLGSTYRTERGFVFTQVEYASFPRAWRAPDGTIWSACIGDFSNIGVRSPAPVGTDPNSETGASGVVTGSDAALACIRIGGHLPFIEDYKSLFSYFYGQAVNDGIYDLTDQDEKDYLFLFPNCPDANGIESNGTDKYPGSFWTATIGNRMSPPMPRHVAGFDAFGDPTFPQQMLSVSCVGR